MTRFSRLDAGSDGDDRRRSRHGWLRTGCVASLFLAACSSSGSLSDPPPAEAHGTHRPSDQRGFLDPQSLLSVGFVITDGVYNTELTAPMDMFHHTVFHAEPGMRAFMVAPSLDPVTTFEGIRLLPDYTFESAPPIDILVVPSAEHSMDSDLEDEALIGFVRERGARAGYVISLCDGAFVLAQAGLLDGRRATTFPADIGRMRSMFPAVEVLDGPSFVHDGSMITSVGGAPSFDPALYLCELLYGEQAARGIAGGLLIDWKLSARDFVAVE